MTKLEALINQSQSALKQFEKVLQQEKNEYIRDSAIKRFEIVFDLSWKLIKAFLEEKGIVCVSPKGCFREAYKQGVIEYDVYWINLISDRNYAVHTYKEALAEKIYKDLPSALIFFQKLLSAIQKAKAKENH